MKKILFAVCISAALNACNSGSNNTEEKPAVDILASHLDTTVKPSDDFFEYANGGWLKKNPIPASESGWGIGNIVQDTIYDRLKTINENAVKADAESGTVTQKIGDFWQSAMDSVALNKAGLSPLQPDIDKINAIKNIHDLINEAAELKMKGVRCLFGDYVSQDDKNSEMMIYRLDQGGLGLPNRDYYFKTDARTQNIRKAYKEYLLKTFMQLGNDSTAAQKNANAVYALETKLATASRKLQDLRDPYKNYNKMAVAQLHKLTPNISWSNYTKEIGINHLDSVVVG